MNVDIKIQLQMVRDRFIDGQADRALRRHLDSLEPNTPMIEMVDSCRIWEINGKEIQPQISAHRRPMHMTCQVTEGDTGDFLGDGVRGRHDQKIVADAGTSVFTGGPRHSYATTNGNDLHTNAGGTGTTSNKRFGNTVTQLVPSGNSQGGGHYPTRAVVRHHRRVFFMRRMDTYYGAMPGFKRVISVLAHRMGGGTQ